MLKQGLFIKEASAILCVDHQYTGELVFVNQTVGVFVGGVGLVQMVSTLMLVLKEI